MDYSMMILYIIKNIKINVKQLNLAARTRK